MDIQNFPLDEVIGIAKRISTLYAAYPGFVSVHPFFSGEVHFMPGAFKALFPEYTRTPREDGGYRLSTHVDGVEIYAHEGGEEE